MRPSVGTVGSCGINHCAEGILKFSVSHRALCTFYKVPHPESWVTDVVKLTM